MCLFYSGVNNKQLLKYFFFSMLFFFLAKKNQLLFFSSFFLYNISGNLEWCVCVYVYSSPLRTFPLWPCYVGGFFFLFIYIFFLFIFIVHIDRLDRSTDRSFVRFLLLFFPFDDNNIAICTIE
jgi:hypothetical protein